MLYSQPMSQRRTGRVSQRRSFKNKTLSPPCLHLQPCLASTPPAGVHSASPPLCTARASRRLPPPPGKQQRGGGEEKSALISSLKTLLAPYLWRTFNSALPQAALPPPRSARWLRLGEESAGTELHLQLPLRLLHKESAGIRKDKWERGGGGYLIMCLFSHHVSKVPSKTTGIRLKINHFVG